MATNVTEKDKTLNEIIDWCEQMNSDWEDAMPSENRSSMRTIYPRNARKPLETTRKAVNK